MRPFIIIVIQILVSAFLTASVMPLILVTTPAAAANPRLGLGLMTAVLLVSFTLVALVWPRRKRR
jgi:hypothetical protein